MIDRSLWTITVGDAEQRLPPEGEWGEVIRSIVAREWGSITARKSTSSERLVLRFNREFGLLERWVSDDGPVSSAWFPNRNLLTEARLELPCCCCGIPLEVPNRYVLRKEDAVRLFLQFLGTGVLPGELVEPPQASVQLVLPGMEEFIVPTAVLNVVNWEMRL